MLIDLEKCTNNTMIALLNCLILDLVFLFYLRMEWNGKLNFSMKNVEIIYLVVGKNKN